MDEKKRLENDLEEVKQAAMSAAERVAEARKELNAVGKKAIDFDVLNDEVFKARYEYAINDLARLDLREVKQAELKAELKTLEETHLELVKSLTKAQDALKDYRAAAEARREERARKRSQVPKVSLDELVNEHASLDGWIKAVRDGEAPPFKLPTEKSDWLDAYPTVFQPGLDNNSAPDIDNLFGCLLKPSVGGSEVVVSSHMQPFFNLCSDTGGDGILVSRNQISTATSEYTRYDGGLFKNNAIVIAEEEKFSSQDLVGAKKELTDKLPFMSRFLMPDGIDYFAGITASVRNIQIFAISYNSHKGAFEAELLHGYDLNKGTNRILALHGLIHLLLFVRAVTGPKLGGLVPNLTPMKKTNTSMGHTVRWYKDSSHGEVILKKFSEQMLGEIRFELLRRVYQKGCLHVEGGMVVNGTANPPCSIMIKTVGAPVMPNIDSFEAQTIYNHIKLAVEELHDLDIAHCDVRLENVFALSDGRFILGDLEYCRKVTDDPPEDVIMMKKVRADPRHMQVSTAADLDTMSLVLLGDALKIG